MIIYEMIYHSGPEDYTSDFYKENSEKSRRHFVNQISKDTRQTLSDYLADPNFNKELYAYVIEAFEEEIETLNHMKVEFIKNGRVNHSSYISIVVAERLVKDV
ncbi:hypothetical protein IEC338SC_3074 [Acinetobacter pittii]|uniref:Uncharacterized protein n=1 Tax=Acinetobacter pittii TaxID=48296 RepID=A0AB33BRU3_ACIPI|nr:hypothetical protein [Acinetobacter pittii]AMX20189.1 hypothetical protein IEC338SC_3074 [Acinetobacter pittii]